MDVDAKTVVPAPTRMGSTPSANAVFGAIGGGIGAAAISATLPIIIPFAVLSAFAAYMLTNNMPKQ